MAGFATLQAAVDAYGDTIGKQFVRPFHKASVTPAATTWHSLWTIAGLPGAGANPAATPGTSYTDVAGGIILPNTSTETKHLTHLGLARNLNTSSSDGMIMIYDRLVGVSGISLVATGNKTISSVALPRYTGTDASQVQAWLEVTTAGTTTACQLSMNSYTNEAGTTGRAGSTFVFPTATPAAATMWGPLPLQAGDKGVRSIEVGLNVSVGTTALIVNVLLIRPLGYVAVRAPLYTEVEMFGQVLAPQRIYDGATIGLALFSSVATAHSLSGLMQAAYG